ncbi:MAG TPA: ATP-grasp domain-containing protein [Candidatus Sulfotelmatobacter sp.]
MARILVLDGHSAAALSVTRSAGRSGHWVAVGANDGLFAAAQVSRYCRSRFSYPVSTDNAARFLDSVLNFVRTQQIDLVIPITDWTLGPLAATRELFSGICRIVLPPASALESASDKFHTVQMAQLIGIETPKTELIRSRGEISGLSQMAFPVVVKDRYSVRWSGDRAVLGSVSYNYSRDEVEAAVSVRLQVADDVLLQEFVPGVGIGFSCFMIEGEVFLPFQWERIREVDPRGSASSARKSIPLNDQLVALSSKLMKEIGFEGIAMVEYKKTADKRMVLMEINGRPWGSMALAVASGIDYPRYLIDWNLTGALPPRNVAYKPDIVCRRIVGELTHLSNLRAGKPSRWPGAYPGFWRTLAKMAVQWPLPMHFDEAWLTDMRPALASLAHWFHV